MYENYVLLPFESGRKKVILGPLEKNEKVSVWKTCQ